MPSAPPPPALTDETRARLGRLRERLDGQDDWAVPALEAALRGFAETEGVGMGKFGPALRGCLAGGAPAPGLVETPWLQNGMGADKYNAGVAAYKARTALGQRFDIRAFHDQVLGSGALPLPILEAKIDGWIAASRS